MLSSCLDMTRNIGLALVVVLGLFFSAITPNVHGAESEPSARAVADAEAPSPMPDELARRVRRLPEEKREFLMSDKVESFTGTREKLHQRLEGKSAKEIEAFVDGMMAVVEAGKFNADTDMAAIPLNTESEDFNA